MLTPRAVRNHWWKDAIGQNVKVVDDEEEHVDSIDYTDEMREHENVASATFDDVSGPTLGVPIIADNIVEFTHKGVGTAILEIVSNFVAYLASLGTNYFGSWHASPWYTMLLSSSSGSGGAGASTGDTVYFNIVDELSTPVTGLDGKYIRVKTLSDLYVQCGPLVYNPGTLEYTGVLLDNLDAADDYAYVNETLACNSVAEILAYDALYAEYSAKTARKLRTPICFIDPDSSTEDYK